MSGQIQSCEVSFDCSMNSKNWLSFFFLWIQRWLWNGIHRENEACLWTVQLFSSFSHWQLWFRRATPTHSSERIASSTAFSGECCWHTTKMAHLGQNGFQFVRMSIRWDARIQWLVNVLAVDLSWLIMKRHLVSRKTRDKIRVGIQIFNFDSTFWKNTDIFLDVSKLHRSVWQAIDSVCLIVCRQRAHGSPRTSSHSAFLKCRIEQYVPHLWELFTIFQKFIMSSHSQLSVQPNTTSCHRIPSDSKIRFSHSDGLVRLTLEDPPLRWELSPFELNNLGESAFSHPSDLPSFSLDHHFLTSQICLIG
jgi:hypothetical protein